MGCSTQEKLGGGSACGSDGYIQYSSGGAFGCSSNFTYDATNHVVQNNGKNWDASAGQLSFRFGTTSGIYLTDSSGSEPVANAFGG